MRFSRLASKRGLERAHLRLAFSDSGRSITSCDWTARAVGASLAATGQRTRSEDDACRGIAREADRWEQRGISGRNSAEPVGEWNVSVLTWFDVLFQPA